MQKVFITRQFPNAALQLIKDAGFIVNMWDSSEPVEYNYMIDKSKDIDGIICTINDKISDDFINSSKNLKVISTMSVGFDHINQSAAQKRNIRIGYTPEVLTDATAELAIGLLLSVSRRLIEGVNSVRDGTWGAWKPFWMCGYGLKDSVVGIVGLGSIGKAIAKRVNSFGVKKLLASGSEKPKDKFIVEIESKVLVNKVCFDELIAYSDFIIVSCSLNENTKDLFNEKTFDKMKKNAILINISRGPVVNQDSLCKALIEGKIAGAGLDVCYPEPLPIDHPLLKLTNCIILPHIGSATIETRNMKNNNESANSSRIPRLPPSIVAIRHKYEDLKIQHRDLQAKYERVKGTWAPPETVRELRQKIFRLTQARDELIVESRGQRLLIHEQSVALRRAFSDMELRAHVPGNIRAGQLGIIPIHHLPNVEDSPVLTTNVTTAINNPPPVLSSIPVETPANPAAPLARHRPNRNKRRRDRRRREEARLQATRSAEEMFRIDDLPPPYQEFEDPGLDPDICYAPRIMFSSPPESIHINLVDEENEPPQVVRALNLLGLGIDEIAILSGEVPNVGPRGEIAGPSLQGNEDFRGDPPPYRPPKRRCLPTDIDAEEN